MSKPTWEILDFGDGPQVYTTDGNPIAVLIGYKKTRLANARLIATAPQLLETCKLTTEMLGLLKPLWGSVDASTEGKTQYEIKFGEIIKTMQLLIAKAEGRE